MEIDAGQFVGVKGMKAKGRRVTSYRIGKVEELEPLRFPESREEDSVEAPADDNDIDSESGSNEDNVRQDNGQLSLF